MTTPFMLSNRRILTYSFGIFNVEFRGFGNGGTNGGGRDEGGTEERC